MEREKIMDTVTALKLKSRKYKPVFPRATGKPTDYTISENLYRVSGFDEISNACNPGYGGAVDDAFFESGNMS